ncbi:MAG: DUF1302 family protein [Pseudomonadota bacterium]
MRKRRWGESGLCVLITLSMLVIFSPIAVAQMTSSFHGFLESSLVMRDVDGMQYGFFDEAYGVQQRNTLKFDVDIDPDMELGPFRVEKVHLTFRGAYDSIYDLAAHRYDIKEDLGASRFDYGEEDIRFESDLREAFIDFAYKGHLGNRAFLRTGRQIVSWGESSLETMCDIINPADQSFQMFFQNPDDVKTPLWMGRLNFDLPRFARTSINFDLLWIPDIRPTQFGPRDSVAGQAGVGLQAPYVSPLFYDLTGQNIREDVPTNNNEYGGKVSAQLGDRLSLSLLYFRDVVNDPGIFIDKFYSGQTANFTHNKQHVYGGYFSYQLLIGRFEAVIRGEASHYTAYPITVATGQDLLVGNWMSIPVAPFMVPLDDQAGVQSFVYKPVTKVMLAVDKDLRIRWISPHDLVNVSFEWLHTTINEWNAGDSDGRLDGPFYSATVTNKAGGPKLLHQRTNSREQDTFFFQAMTNWWASKLNPMLIVAYNMGKHGDGATWMLRPQIKWTITPNLYTQLTFQAFLGDDESSYAFSNFVNGPTEATIKLGYEW